MGTDRGSQLCGRPANLEHILSSCRASLTEGGFRWSHDQLLAHLADRLDKERKIRAVMVPIYQLHQTRRKGRQIEWGHKDPQHGKGLGGESRLGKATQIPRGEPASLRPDIVLWSQDSKQVVLVELTIPWEERMKEAHKYKVGKYQPLILESQQKRWKAWNLPVEVGCRGFPIQSLWRTLGVLGVRGSAHKNLVGNITSQAEAAYRCLWLKRSEW